MRFLSALAFSLLLTIAPAVSADGDTERTGSFEGKSRHKVSGTVSVVAGSDGAELVLGKDFDFDGAPDPKLAFGKDGYEATTLFSPLRKDKGTQRYVIPPSINPNEYNEVWIWCEKFDVPLAKATLSSP